MRKNTQHVDGISLFSATAEKTSQTRDTIVLDPKKFPCVVDSEPNLHFDNQEVTIAQLVANKLLRNFKSLADKKQYHEEQYHNAPGSISLRKSKLTYNYDPTKAIEQAIINRLACFSLRVNITKTRLEDHAKNFLESVITESKKLTGNPFRISHEVCASNIKEIEKYKKEKYISEIILIGTIPKKFKELNASCMDISQAKLENYATLKTMHFYQTKINRTQFFYLMKCNLLKFKLEEPTASIDLSFADITRLDLRGIDFTQVYLRKTQDLTRCIITVAQANDLAKAGITTLKSAFILEEKGVDNRLNKLDEAVINQGGKITISSKELEKLFETHCVNDIDLAHYQMTLPELEKMLKKLGAKHSFFHETKSTLQLIKLIPFMQQQIKKYGIKKIILSNMNFEHVNFSDFNFDNVLMRHCVFKRVDFENAHCEQAQFHGCKFTDCSFDRICMSKNTSFKDSKLGKDKENTKDKGNTENTINEVTYQYETLEGKIATCILRPNDFYTKVKERHRNILKTENKSRFFHGFFDKTDKSIYSNRSKDLSLNAAEWFIGMLKINKQIEKNKGGVTARATQAFFEEAAAAASASIAPETASIVMAH